PEPSMQVGQSVHNVFGSNSVLTAKSIFAGVRKSLECTPQCRCGGMVDATDLKLQFWRFRRFALLFKSCAVHEGKSLELANFRVSRTVSKKRLILAQILVQRRSGLKLRWDAKRGTF